MARRTKEFAERTREAILDAAEHLFHQRGVSHTSLDGIARAAGVTRGAVYWHFRDKADLFTAMQARARLPQEDVIECLLGEEGPDAYRLERLRDACREILWVMANDERRGRVYTILFHRCEYVEDMDAVAERMRLRSEQMLENLTRYFQRAARRGELGSLWQPREAAFALHGLMTGMLSHWLARPDRSEMVETGSRCLDAFFRTLRPDPVAAPGGEETVAELG